MKHFLFLIAFLSITKIYSQSDLPNIIIGKWLNYDKTEIVEINFKDNVYIGNIIWMKQPNDEIGNPKIDSNNPNKKLRKKPVLGSQNIFGLQYKNEKWQNGSIYSHKRGGSINFKIISINEAKLILKISKFLFSKEIIYTRTK